jgi:hypothetical protein
MTDWERFKGDPRCEHYRLLITDCEKCGREAQPGHKTQPCGMTITQCQRSGGCNGRVCDPYKDDYDEEDFT